jgi:hypothetical protein
MNTQIPLWCIFSSPSSGDRNKTVANVTDDSIECSGVPGLPGLYDISLTFDGLNFLTAGSQLNVVAPGHVGVSSVFPQLIALQDEPFRSSPWSFHVLGHGLDSLRP